MKLLIFLATLTIAAPGFAGEYKPCKDDPTRLQQRQAELKTIRDADQADRSLSNLDSQRDLQRRKRVAEIFAEGCISSAADYANAALVFQHGDAPDHYFQAFIWSLKAVELGDTSQKAMVANGIDRYLVNTGHKQLFASQAFRPPGSKCWCLHQVENSFPDKLRVEYKNKNLQQALEWIAQLNSNAGNCPAIQCPVTLKPTSRGSVPGFW